MDFLLKVTVSPLDGAAEEPAAPPLVKAFLRACRDLGWQPDRVLAAEDLTPGEWGYLEALARANARKKRKTASACAPREDQDSEEYAQFRAKAEERASFTEAVLARVCRLARTAKREP